MAASAFSSQHNYTHIAARRAFVVTSPLKVTITNYDSQNKEEFIIPRHPKDESFGERTVPFGKEIYIEESDFFDGENPPKGFKRLVAGGKVRLRNAYVITCEEVVRDENNKPIELLCTYDDRTGNGVTPEGEKRVQGIVQCGLVRWQELCPCAIISPSTL